MAHETDGSVRVHGMVSRQCSEYPVASLLHTCSLLRIILHPVFINTDAFAVTIFSRAPEQIYYRLIEWYSVFGVASADQPVKPLLLLELQAGLDREINIGDALDLTKAVDLRLMAESSTAHEVQFRPRLCMQRGPGVNRTSYYAGSGGLMRVYTPHTVTHRRFDKQDRTLYCLAHDRITALSSDLPSYQPETWAGWVANPVNGADLEKMRAMRVVTDVSVFRGWQD